MDDSDRMADCLSWLASLTMGEQRSAKQQCPLMGIPASEGLRSNRAFLSLSPHKPVNNEHSCLTATAIYPLQPASQTTVV